MLLLAAGCPDAAVVQQLGDSDHANRAGRLLNAPAMPVSAAASRDCVPDATSTGSAAQPRPSRTGSWPTLKTIGIVAVAALAASVAVAVMAKNGPRNWRGQVKGGMPQQERSLYT